MKISVLSSLDPKEELQSHIQACLLHNLITSQHEVFILESLKDLPLDQYAAAVAYAIMASEHIFVLYDANKEVGLYKAMIDLLIDESMGKTDKYTLIMHEDAESNYINGNEILYKTEELPFEIAYQAARYVQDFVVNHE